MRVFSIMLLSSLLITGAGCFKSPEPTVLPEQPERESENMVGEVSISSTELNKEFILNEFAECKVRISYPNFENAALPNVVSMETDREISHFIAQALGHAEDVAGTHELETIVNDYMAQCQSEIEAEYAALDTAGDELFTNLKRTVDIVYEIKLNKFHLLTLGLNEYSYSGGAHPNQVMEYLNLDRGGDKLLTLRDVVAPEHLKAFLQYEKSQLLANHRENLYPEHTEEYDALIEDTTNMTAEDQDAQYGSLSNFYLTETSIVTYYNTYEIAPYAAGPILVEIPYADVKDYLSLNGPLVPLIENL